MRLYNTLTKREEAFRPLEAGRVTFYTCGPTVYDYAHIGNFRTFIASDVLRRWLESPLCRRVAPNGEADVDPLADLGSSVERAVAELENGSRDRAGTTGGAREVGVGGYAVRHVMNITDVGHMTDDSAGTGEDRMEVARQRLAASKKSGTLPADAPPSLDPSDPFDVAAFYAQAFTRDAVALGVKVAEEASEAGGGPAASALLPCATASVGEMLRLIVDLLDKGCAYVVDGVCYFDTQRFDEYGRLSGNTLERIRSGAGGRVSAENQAAKRHPADFLLWKHDESHLMKWDPQEELGASPELAGRASAHGLLRGYPGWHVECSAMARACLGDEIDLHSGGEDLIFPHHECEIAQSRCATGRASFARYWMHVRFLQVDGEKMSKSAGNFFTARHVLDRGFSAAALRLALLAGHYRQNLNFTESGLSAGESQVGRWRAFMDAGVGAATGTANRDAAEAFTNAMNDDLNVAGAIAAVNTFVRDVRSPTRADAGLLRLFDDVLSVVRLLPAASGSTAGLDETLTSEVNALVRARQDARQRKDFGAADDIRERREALGVDVTDGPDGPTWTLRKRL